jgi:hypothetical protein
MWTELQVQHIQKFSQENSFFLRILARIPTIAPSGGT